MAFAGGVGPATGATQVTLVDVSALAVGDLVEFRLDASTVERQPITTIDAATNTITWATALTEDFSGGVRKSSRITALRPSVIRALAFTTPTGGPESGTTSIVLSDVSNIVAGLDVVEFWNPSNQVERRPIATVNAATNAISWDPTTGLINDYSVAGSTVHLIRGGEVPVTETAGLSAGDLVWLERNSEELHAQLVRIAEGGVNVGAQTITLDASEYLVQHSYEAGDSLALRLAGRTTTNRVDLRSTNNFYPQAVIEIDDGVTKSYYTIEEIAGRSLVLTAPLDRDIPDEAAVRIVELQLLLEAGTTTELFDNLSLNAEAPNFVGNVVNLRSRLVQVRLRNRLQMYPSTYHTPIRACPRS